MINADDVESRDFVVRPTWDLIQLFFRRMWTH